MCHCIKKKNNYVIPKNVRFGEYKLVKDISMSAIMAVLALTLSFSQEAAMLDVETSKSKKIIKRKKYLQVVNLLKEFIEATTITKYILDLEVILTIDKLLALALAIEKQHTKAITEDKAMQF